LRKIGEGGGGDAGPSSACGYGTVGAVTIAKNGKPAGLPVYDKSVRVHREPKGTKIEFSRRTIIIHKLI
jgi:hypothetical protein